MNNNNSNPYLLTPNNLERVEQNTLSINQLRNLKQKGINTLHRLGRMWPINRNPTNADPKTLLRNQLLGRERQQEPQPGEQHGGRRRTTRHKHRKHKRSHKSKRRYRR